MHWHGKICHVGRRFQRGKPCHVKLDGSGMTRFFHAKNALQRGRSGHGREHSGGKWRRCERQRRCVRIPMVGYIRRIRAVAAWSFHKSCMSGKNREWMGYKLLQVRRDSGGTIDGKGSFITCNSDLSHSPKKLYMVLAT